MPMAEAFSQTAVRGSKVVGLAYIHLYILKLSARASRAKCIHLAQLHLGG